ncbi:transcription termination/antitermination protein NusA [Proteiniclasticum sp. SCR006]|uniref:Transcription termination/antitermination protein NusA n=1 Tax=Proteiniclasticum aestuarii TaxID=2817862 RepID=A0A939H733_9CLOT|nr:transcription termination factor NusA [Proteiniclasticum aestuarii]MBO1263674.1 transcription termination/antitermination protein NusA [Proteiniclasticum aestuarii]
MAKATEKKKDEVILALKAIAEEKGISEEMLFETLEDAMIAAYKKNYVNSGAQNVRVNIDRETGEIKVYSLRQVVEEVMDPQDEISLEEAKEINPTYELLDFVENEVTPANFARVAAQSAKQIVTQRIKEAERSILYNQYHEKEFDVITGTVQRKDKGNVYISLGKTETVLTPSEQIPGERYEFNDKILLYIVEVKQNPKGPMISVSRTHPGLVKRLFEKEVPEIYEGIVEIKAISREAGSRTKIAVHSNDPEVEPMGACVGPRGTRVQNIVNELRNEKIDIIKWSKDPKEFIANALSPSKVLDVIIMEEGNSCKVIVDDNQLSLAIGKEGQNVRLAAKLTGWKIDIKSRKQYEAELEAKKEAEEAMALEETELTADVENDDAAIVDADDVSMEEIQDEDAVETDDADL